MRKTILRNEQFYHIYNRGVDKRVIFKTKADHERFLNAMFYFNDVASIGALRLDRFKQYVGDSVPDIKTRDELVDIVAWCLMPNHFHMILRQLSDGGISKFLQKIGTGYTTYFNLRYGRSGVLFQGAFKSKHIQKDSYIMHLVRYIHLNPVSLIYPGWEEHGIPSWSKAMKFLDNYKWSSHIDYNGGSGFPELINRKWLPKYPTIDNGYSDFLRSWLTKNWSKL